MFLTFTLTKESPRVIYSNKVSIQTHRSKSVSELLEVATENAVFKNFAIFPGKHLCCSIY